ncbi:TyeA family type III secretion system gatekeeper subunit [Desulfospira joergensenii]|uniref:TyeA family type III secretion system gatekeeper subunit n=1 Tax=Desulfospira joergensenii TaxID=53329 RepID=UPI0003B6C355|nr:TyeA family type III secretion system gatekeeper subunit [Desulfospira joergensenii]
MDIGGITQQYQQMIDSQAARPEAQGSFAGMKISVSDPTSLIMNSAEEASFAMSEREEARIEERKLKPKGPNTQRLEQVEKYTELMDRQGQKKDLESFVSSLAKKSNLDPRAAAEEALTFFKDNAGAYTALGYARKKLSDTFGEDLFLEAMDQLEDLAGDSIKTQLAAGVAAMEHGTLGEAKQLTDLFEETIGNLGSPMDIYERIVTEYGEERLEEAIAFLRKSRSNMLSATSSETDKTLLNALNDDLGSLQLLNSLDSQCKTLNTQVKDLTGKAGMTSTQFVREILKLGNTNFIGPFDIEEMAGKVGVKKIEDKIVFMQSLSAAAQDFSEHLFIEPQGRLNIIEATQAALDDAIDIEDQMYEE